MFCPIGFFDDEKLNRQSDGIDSDCVVLRGNCIDLLMGIIGDITCWMKVYRIN